MTMIHAQVTKLKYSPADRAYLLLSFRAETDQDFDDARRAVLSLPREYRRWMEAQRVWRIRAIYLLRLAPLWPSLSAELARLGSSSTSGGSQDRYRYGTGSTSSTSGTSWRSPSRPMLPADVERAYALLALTPSAPLELIQAARKVYSKIHHPDAGGSVERMKILNNACDVAATWARAHPQQSRSVA